MLGIRLRPEVFGFVITAKLTADEVVYLAAFRNRIAILARVGLEGTHSLAGRGAVLGIDLIFHCLRYMPRILAPYCRAHCGLAIYPHCAFGDGWVGQQRGTVLRVSGLLGGQDSCAKENCGERDKELAFHNPISFSFCGAAGPGEFILDAVSMAQRSWTVRRWGGKLLGWYSTPGFFSRASTDSCTSTSGDMYRCRARFTRIDFFQRPAVV